MASRFADLGTGKKLMLAAFALSAVAGPVAFGLMQDAPQSSQILHATGPLPSFEVATIKPDDSASNPVFFGAAGHGAPMDRFVATNVSVRKLMGWAYAGNSLPLPDYEISGGPAWIDSDRYDIDAKLEDSQVAALQRLSENDRILLIRRTVQALLADRFKLVVNDTTEMRPVYALVVAKGGLKMSETAPCSPPPPGLAPPPPPPPGASPASQKPAAPPQMQLAGRPGDLVACELPVMGLVRVLQFGLDRPIVDQTGLTGNYTFELKWTPDFDSPMPGPSPSAEPPPPSDNSGPSLFTALQEQLGLKLESTKGPVETLEIQHIEKPSEN
jgi:bla regulator protein blaR1